MSFRLVSKSMTLNDLERCNGRYFALFQRIRVVSGGALCKSSRSLSHLLMSSCLPRDAMLARHLHTMYGLASVR